MKTTIIHHSADLDGLFSGVIAYYLLPVNTELVGWDFADKPLEVPEGDIFILDLPVDRVFGWRFPKDTLPDELRKRIVWIDHHKTSIESHPTDIPGYRIEGVAACRLTWQYLHTSRDNMLPTREDYVNRAVREPIALRLAGEYDVWDKRDPDAELLQYGLRAAQTDNLNGLIFDLLMDDDEVPEILHEGAIARTYARHVDAETVAKRAFRLQFHGLNFLCLNSARVNSLTFASIDKPESGHDALMGFNFNGKAWSFSLYHAAHRTDLDLTTIAKIYGGGGHPGACGFTLTELPPLLDPNITRPVE